MYLYDLLGKRVRVNNDGPESRTGRLLSLGWDYLVVDTENDGVVYYHLRHVKSLSELQDKESDGRSRDVQDHVQEDPQFVRANSFMHVLRTLRDQQVQINRGGPDKLVGKLVGFGPGFLVLEQNNERMRVPLFHIKNVNIIEQVEDQSTEQKQNQKEMSTRNRDGNQNKKGKRQSNRSSNRSKK